MSKPVVREEASSGGQESRNRATAPTQNRSSTLIDTGQPHRSGRFGAWERESKTTIIMPPSASASAAALLLLTTLAGVAPAASGFLLPSPSSRPPPSPSPSPLSRTHDNAIRSTTFLASSPSSSPPAAAANDGPSYWEWLGRQVELKVSKASTHARAPIIAPQCRAAC